MKKLLPGLVVFFAAAFFSCSKQTVKQDTPSPLTTNPNLKSGATGITLADASTIALQFLKSRNPNTTITLKDAQTIVKNAVPYFHVINANAGFVILSADSVYAPLLAYDSAGNFSLAAENINPGLINWFNKHAQELDFMRNNKSAYIDTIAKNNKILWKGLGAITAAGIDTRVSANAGTLGAYPANADGLPVEVISATPVTNYTISNIGPLCPTLWGQDYPFNYYCPAANLPGRYVNHAPAGCVPIAMAQVAYFWKYPGSYNWGGMPLTKQAALSLPVTDASRLIYNLGLKVGTGYDASGSGTDVSKVPGGFFALGYSAANNTASLTQQALSGAYNGTSYAGFITNEIQTYKRPCIVSGAPIYNSVLGLGVLPTPGGTGHTWVCDGSNVTTISYGTQYTYHEFGQIVTSTTYTSTQSISLLHMNWGWEDFYIAAQDDQASNVLTNNGWYNCNINYTQASSASTNFQYFQIITYNIHP